jgi:hypothetical protein
MMSPQQEEYVYPYGQHFRGDGFARRFQIEIPCIFRCTEERFPLWGRPSGAFDVSGTFVRSFWMAGPYPPAAAEMNPTGPDWNGMRRHAQLPLIKREFSNNLSRHCQELFPMLYIPIHDDFLFVVKSAFRYSGSGYS